MGALWADTKAWYELHSQTGNKEATGCRGRRGEVERWQANNCAKLMMRHSAAKTKGQGDTTNSSRSNSCTTNRIRGRGKGKQEKKAINCEVRGRGGGWPTEATPCRGKALSDVMWQVESTERRKNIAPAWISGCASCHAAGVAAGWRGRVGKGLDVAGVANQVRRFLISPISVDVFIKFPA